MKRKPCKYLFYLLIISLFCTSLSAPSIGISSSMDLEFLKPGYLVAPILYRQAQYTGTEEQITQFQQVDLPILRGVLGQDPSFYSARGNKARQKLMNGLNLSANVNANASALQSMAAHVQEFVSSDDMSILTLESLRVGRWGGLSTTMSQPWVWARFGLDVFGMGKIIPFGPWPLADEKKRTNVGLLGNHQLFLINWFYCTKKALTLHVSKEILWHQVESDTQNLYQNIFSGNLSSIIAQASSSYHQYRKMLGVVEIGEEIVRDGGEVLRGPLIIASLLSRGEFLFAWRSVKSYLAEVYDTLNRNRKFFSLHPVGTAYLYATLNLLVFPLLIFDAKEFYIKDLHLRYHDLCEQKPYSPEFYGRLIALIGKALSPVFAISQLYDAKMQTVSMKVVTGIAHMIPGFWPGLLRTTALIKKVSHFSWIAWPIEKASVLLQGAHCFMGRYGGMIYSKGLWVTGVFGTLSVTAYSLNIAIQDAEEVSPVLSVAMTAGIFVAYGLMYTTGAQSIYFMGLSLTRWFTLLQTAVVVGGLVFDEVIIPLTSIIQSFLGHDKSSDL